jgi:hypothetical protein
MGVSAASTVFLAALLYVYVRNHHQLQSVFTLGLVFFAALLMFQSLGSIYFDWMMAESGVGSAVALPMLALNIAELVGFVALFWVTWR